MKLYHGTYYSAAMDILNNGIDLSKGSSYADFGQGFYTTPNKEKAIQRAKYVTMKINSMNNRNECPCIVVCNYTIQRVCDTLRIKEFSFREDDWFYFVIHNRLDTKYLFQNNITNHNRDSKYDIVIGEIADKDIATIVYKIKNNQISIKNVNISDIIPNNHSNYGTQISFHTYNGCSCIIPKYCDIIKT